MKKLIHHPLFILLVIVSGAFLMFTFKDEQVVLTVLGLALLMWGLYKTSKRTGQKPEENMQTEDKNQEDA